MAKLKAFYAGQNYPIEEQIRELLGLPTHRRYGSGLIVGETKAAAVALTEALRAQGLPVSRPYATELRVSTSPDTEALRDAGLLDEPAILLMSSDTLAGPVVRISSDGFKVVGDLVLDRDSRQRRFEVTGTVHVTFTPDQVQALLALLDLVHYDDLAQQWRDMLPRELLTGAAVSETKEN